MCFAAEAGHLPSPGETVEATAFARYPGGKGINQAVAAARLGVEVSLLGRVGQDPWADELLKRAKENGVDTSSVEVAPLPSGATLLILGPDGESLAAYAPGANRAVDREYLERVLPLLREVEVLILSLEIPLEPLGKMVGELSPERPLLVLDPARAPALAPLPLHRVDVVVPDRHGLRELGGWSGEVSDLELSAKSLLRAGFKNLVIYAGPHGALLVEQGGVTRFSSPLKTRENPNSADTFIAALAVRLGQGRGIYEAVGFANAAAALSGAQGLGPTFPTLIQVQALLSRSA